jgi:hypothetical protein
MTTKHLLEGAMQYAKARNHYHFALLTELDRATVTRMAQGRYSGMRIETLDRIQRASGAPVEMLFKWYRMPEDAVLGRVHVESAS